MAAEWRGRKRDPLQRPPPPVTHTTPSAPQNQSSRELFTQYLRAKGIVVTVAAKMYSIYYMYVCYTLLINAFPSRRRRRSQMQCRVQRAATARVCCLPSSRRPMGIVSPLPLSHTHTHTPPARVHRPSHARLIIIGFPFNHFQCAVPRDCPRRRTATGEPTPPPLPPLRHTTARLYATAAAVICLND